MIKKILNNFLSFISITIALSSCGYMGYSIAPMFPSLTSKEKLYYSYQELPTNLKWIIYEFELSAHKHQKDVSKVREIRYALIKNKNWNLGGYYDFITNTVFLNYTNPNNYYGIREVLWHEFGHGIMHYTHDPKDATTHIMNSGYSKSIPLAWEQRKEEFFNNPIKWQFDLRLYKGPINLLAQKYNQYFKPDNSKNL